MSALALIARRRGVAVTGCDTDLGGAADVAQAGARLWQGQDGGAVEGGRGGGDGAGAWGPNHGWGVAALAVVRRRGGKGATKWPKVHAQRSAG